eukprot:2626515-Alexandrium_andersonii.AAC.1
MMCIPRLEVIAELGRGNSSHRRHPESARVQRVPLVSCKWHLSQSGSAGVRCRSGFPNMVI